MWWPGWRWFKSRCLCLWRNIAHNKRNCGGLDTAYHLYFWGTLFLQWGGRGGRREGRGGGGRWGKRGPLWDCFMVYTLFSFYFFLFSFFRTYVYIYIQHIYTLLLYTCIFSGRGGGEGVFEYGHRYCKRGRGGTEGGRAGPKIYLLFIYSPIVVLVG